MTIPRPPALKLGHTVTRRRVVVGLAVGVFALLVPRAGVSQQRGRVYRIGYLANDADPRKCSLTFRAFVERLNKLGWIEGKNIEIRVRTSRGQDDRFPELVAETLRDKVDVILTGGSASTQAAKAATETVPIVFGSAADPVKQKFVASLRRPGRNVTGLALAVEELEAKRLELFKVALPRAREFARLYDANSIASLQPAIISENEKAAAKARVALRHMPVAQVDGIKAAFAAAARSRIDGVIVTAAGLFVGNRARIAEIAIANRMPTMCADGRFTDAGALLSYGENYPARYRRAANVVDKIFRGTKPADIPVEEPTAEDWECVVNMGTAKALGFTFPESFFSLYKNRDADPSNNLCD